ncbi:AAA family ATPase [Campylobacter corcagiensis]|uniref:AAA family ATPase n=1 Tax=Campylobacter corcagiensis TaxID=1448857 RepID=A0A7M1LGE6_9BACT|nr:MoxR family ATPase [Campylobacter corcagiensis]QKF64411.1 MoxR-like ATPase [Campylobacter corcagiensis]QOQ87403.1 AAA family ATPase [Campylobacter corcagiensis]
MSQVIENIKNEVKKVIVGQEELINSLLIGLVANGHILVEGVPGLAKTTAINSLAKAIGLSFKRVQFTPDLLPSDIVGSEIYNMKTGNFEIKKGPAFTNLLLADEINRAPSKVQSALLEVMQEHQITIGDKSFKIDEPFLVMATQNPIEQEGAYRLPEAQLDRFMMNVLVGYNSFDEEVEIVDRVAVKGFDKIEQVATKDDILALREEPKNIHIDEEVKRYIIRLIHATREPEDYALSELREYIQFGASPRASIDLYKASLAFAFINSKDYVTPLDIAKIVKSVLRHRITLNYKARAKGITTDDIISKVLEAVKAP